MPQDLRPTAGAHVAAFVGADFDPAGLAVRLRPAEAANLPTTRSSRAAQA